MGNADVLKPLLQATIESFPSYDVQDGMANAPAMEEVRTALSLITGNRAGGNSGILPEMVKVCSDELLEYLVNLFTHVWNSRSVPQDWKDALLIPVPKKGNLSLCDNWRSISLLEVVGKVFAKIIQRRLQVLVEDVVTDSQCGFRSSRGCADMIFCARQLVEKAIEHNTKVFLFFIDLRKAYDSVPRSAMWLALQKYGVPDMTVDLVRGLHEHVEATVSVAGESAQIQVSNGLRQGCVLALTLFLLYFNMVMLCWRARCASLGVKLLYKCGLLVRGLGHQCHPYLLSCVLLMMLLLLLVLGKTLPRPPWSCNRSQLSVV